MLAALKAEPPGDKALDEVALKLAAFAPTRADVKTELLKQTSPDQLVRLVKKSETEHNYSAQKVFAEHYLQNYSRRPEAVEMRNIAARALFISDNNEEKALMLWDSVVKNPAADPMEVQRAKVYSEAVRGPKSVAALEAAHEMGWIQNKVLGDFTHGVLACARVIKATQEPFFAEYLTHDAIAPKDKAELLYKLLFNYHQGGHYKEVPKVAGQIFSLVGYDEKISQKAAFAIPLGQQMQGQYEASAEGFASFVQAYPLSQDAARASFYCGQSLQMARKSSDAMVQLYVTEQLYPGTQAGKDALGMYQSMMRKDPDGNWLAEAKKDQSSRLAELKQVVDPATIWLAQPVAVKQSTVITKAENEPTTSNLASVPEHNRFERLATVLSSTSEGDRN